MGRRGVELVTTYEPSVVTKSLFDAVVVKDGQSDGRLADPAGTNKGNWGRVFCQCETNDLLDQLIASKEIPRRRGWEFSGYARFRYETMTRVEM